MQPGYNTRQRSAGQPLVGEKLHPPTHPPSRHTLKDDFQPLQDDVQPRRDDVQPRRDDFQPRRDDFQPFKDDFQLRNDTMT